MESPQRTLNETVLTTNGSTNNSLTNLNWQNVCFNFTFNAGDDKFFISVKEGTSGSPTIGVVFDDVVITDKTVCSVCTPPPQ